MSRISEKLSKIVSSQLPEFVQADNPKFVAFVEAYYRFLEQDQSAFEVLQNSRSYNDLDRTVDSFVRYFIDTYAPSIPENLLTDKKFLIKRIKDLYEAKGSELSFKLLFSTFFDSSVSITYPFENVLRASDGKWEQRFSIRVRTDEGSINDISNRFLRHSAGGIQYNTPIVAYKILSSTETEIFLDPNFLSSSYSVGDYVEVLDHTHTSSTAHTEEEGGELFKGTITSTPTAFSISRPGLNFRLGQVFAINFSGGTGTLVKVSNVNSTGGITDLKFINYGFNYPFTLDVFTVQLDPSKTVSQLSDRFVTSEKMNGFTDSGSILTYEGSSTDRYFESDYVDYSTILYTYTSILGTFGDTTFNPSPVVTSFDYNENLASIVFREGALGKYPGSYFTNDSFLSEAEVRLEDSTIYQPFAYLTNTSLDIDTFYDLVKGTVHPAGQILYNNRLISGEINLANIIYITPQANIIGNEALDVFDVYDESLLELNKVINDIQEIKEEFSLVRIKPVVDTQSILDDEANVNVVKTINDTTSFSESISLVFPNKPAIVDALNIQDVFGLSLSLPINNTDATVNFTETGFLLQANAETFMFSESYVYDDYVGGTVINIT